MDPLEQAVDIDIVSIAVVDSAGFDFAANDRWDVDSSVPAWNGVVSFQAPGDMPHWSHAFRQDRSLRRDSGAACCFRQDRADSGSAWYSPFVCVTPFHRRKEAQVPYPCAFLLQTEAGVLIYRCLLYSFLRPSFLAGMGSPTPTLACSTLINLAYPFEVLHHFGCEFPPLRSKRRRQYAVELWSH